jgi:hypothetical protein
VDEPSAIWLLRSLRGVYRWLFVQQLGESVGPVVFIDAFHVAPEEVDDFHASWTVDGEFIKRHRGIHSSDRFHENPALSSDPALPHLAESA